MPDGYEHLHSCLNPLVNDAGTDPDHDGVTSLQEYTAGTDPCSAAPSVGGVAEAPDVAESAPEGSSSFPYGIAGASAGLILAFAAGGWYARRRVGRSKG